MNISLAKKVIEAAVSVGVQDFCVCAGARNSPLVFLLNAAKGLRLYSFFEERSASFFALGKIQATGRPVGIVTTSGTAVAELLPAVVESNYSGWPLLMITADRPRSYRGTGAPQTIEQVGIFSQFIETCWDLADTEDVLPIQNWTQKRPLQINVCFTEPLIDEPIPSLNLHDFSISTPNLKNLSLQFKRILPRPLIVCGTLSTAINKEIKENIINLLLQLNAPVYAEALSGLRGENQISHLLLSGGENSVQEIFEKNLCQSVLRIGGVPTLRFWRDLEDKYQKIPVYSISDNDYPGLSRRSHHIVGFQNLNVFDADFNNSTNKNFHSEIFHLDLLRTEKLQGLLNKFLKSEVALIADLAKQLQGQSIFLGNSLPIREWDLVASPRWSFARLAGHRGANGIDGQVSGFLGWCQTETENWCLVGDLTALYDLQALWIKQQMKSKKIRIVVINNCGGQIFKRTFENEFFLNRHDFDFSSWAEMWKWPYLKWSSIPKNMELPDFVLIELNPDETQSDQFWSEYK